MLPERLNLRTPITQILNYQVLPYLGFISPLHFFPFSLSQSLSLYNMQHSSKVSGTEGETLTGRCPPALPQLGRGVTSTRDSIVF